MTRKLTKNEQKIKQDNHDYLNNLEDDFTKAFKEAFKEVPVEANSENNEEKEINWDEFASKTEERFYDHNGGKNG